MVVSSETQSRRDVHFGSLSEVLADAQTAIDSKYQPIGNWSAGQIFTHVAIGMESSIDGFKFKVAWPLKWFMSTFVKKRMLRRGIPSGVKLKGDAARLFKPNPCEDQEGLDRLRTAIHRLESETQRRPSPLLGELSVEEWNDFHLRHCELHFSFLVPPPEVGTDQETPHA